MAQIPFLILMFGAMYYFVLRPQKKRAEAQRQLLNNLAEGTEVMTTSGIYGFVTAVDGDVVWLEIATGVDVRVAKAAIAKLIDSPVSSVADQTALPIGSDVTEDETLNDISKNDISKNDISKNDISKNDTGGTSGDN
jgi:preprotein translocase subunit YajC